MKQPTQGSHIDAAQLLRDQAISLLTGGKPNEGVRLLEQVLGLRPQSGDAHSDLATAYWQTGKPQKAEEHYARAAQLAPKDPYVLNNYGAFLLEQARLPEAAELLNRARAIKPDHYEIPNNLGLLHYRTGNMKQAEEFFMQAIRLNPQWSNAHANFGNVLRKTGRKGPAEAAFRQAIKLNPGNAVAWADLGYLYAVMLREEDALKCYKRAISLAPYIETSWVRLLDLLEKTDKTDESAELTQKAKGRFPDSVAIITHEAKLLRRQGKIDAAIALMEKHAASLQKDSPLNCAFFFELGQLYDRANDAGKAFECFVSANRGQANTVAANAIDKTAFTGAIERLRRDFTAEMADGPVPATAGPGPVFLIGFPRSGTTLLDQILSSHPAISVAEERPGVHRMLQKLGEIAGGAAEGVDGFWNDPRYPACLSSLTADDIAALRAAFFEGHGRQEDGDGKIFVDKLPLNILHAGIIRRVFPQAKFILALRHPCDSVLSCFMQQFNLNLTMAHFLDIGDAAKFYDGVFGLWAHYEGAVRPEAHSIRYEDVVADFRPTIGKLLEFIGAGWDEAVMEYDSHARGKGIINTPSYSQVTQKIYTRASGRWLRYREQMKPVLGILEPHARKFGYSMEE